MAQITIRRTVTGPANTFSSDFAVSGSATLTLEETVEDTHVSGAPLVIDMPIPNDDTALPIKGVLFEATGDIDSITFWDTPVTGGNQIDSGGTPLTISSIEGIGSAYFWPSESGQTAPSTFANDSDIARIEVFRPGGGSGPITLYGFVIYDATFTSS